MPPQGDLIQLSPSCNGRYINPKGGSSRPRCQPFLQKLQHWTNRAVTGSIARVKHQDSKTPHLEEYSFLVAGALALVFWTSAGKPSITALGPVWAIPTTSRAPAEDARSCPEAGTVSLAWSESPKEADTRGELAPRTRSGRASPGPCVNPKHIILLICAGHSERWIARTAVDSGETPWHFTARRTKFHWGSRRSADGWSQKGKLGQKSQQRRVKWPLREGREIWGVDGAFASMTWRRHCVRDGVAPSANELAWFYMGFRLGHAVGVPDA